MSGLWLRFLSGPDIDSLGLTNAEIVAAAEGPGKLGTAAEGPGKLSADRCPRSTLK